MSLPNMWEFPGGKIERVESLESAIEREIMEELDYRVKALDIFHDNTHEYENVIVNLICIRYRVPTSNEHSELICFRRENLQSLRCAPTYIPTVDTLIEELEINSKEKYNAGYVLFFLVFKIVYIYR